MPKKKKKLYNKRSLSFVESPKHIWRQFPEAVHASDSPLNARVVELGSDYEFQWVITCYIHQPFCDSKESLYTCILHFIGFTGHAAS